MILDFCDLYPELQFCGNGSPWFLRAFCEVLLNMRATASEQ